MAILVNRSFSLSPLTKVCLRRWGNEEGEREAVVYGVKTGLICARLLLVVCCEAEDIRLPGVPSVSALKWHRTQETRVAKGSAVYLSSSFNNVNYFYNFVA